VATRPLAHEAIVVGSVVFAFAHGAGFGTDAFQLPGRPEAGFIRSAGNQFRMSSNRSAKCRYIGTTDRIRRV
jgi:hypothetical protein